MSEPKFRSPSNLARMLKIYRLTGSMPLAFQFLSKGSVKPVLHYLENGGKLIFEHGRWIAKYGHQFVLVERLVGKQFHILEHLDPVELSGWNISYSISGEISIQYNGQKIQFDSYDGIMNMVEFFSEYECLYVKGKTVLDIGLYRGESALYFLLKGAQKVLAIEPNKEHYLHATETVRKNGFSNKIDIRNVGLGNEVHEFDSRSGGLEAGPLWSMEDFQKWVAGNKEKDRDLVMKIDCEGCEYVLYKRPEFVAEWKNLGLKEFVMEYHEGDILTLVENWRSNGFYVYRIVQKSNDCGIIHGILRD